MNFFCFLLSCKSWLEAQKLVRHFAWLVVESFKFNVIFSVVCMGLFFFLFLLPPPFILYFPLSSISYILLCHRSSSFLDFSNHLFGSSYTIADFVWISAGFIWFFCWLSQAVAYGYWSSGRAQPEGQARAFTCRLGGWCLCASICRSLVFHSYSFLLFRRVVVCSGLAWDRESDGLPHRAQV